jgi:hypothetical protein
MKLISLLVTTGCLLLPVSPFKLFSPEEPGDYQFNKVDIRKAMEASTEFNQDLFDKLLTRLDSEHIFLTETRNLIKSLAMDFPEVVSVSTVGYTWQNRPIEMITIDASESLITSLREQRRNNLTQLEDSTPIFNINMALNVDDEDTNNILKVRDVEDDELIETNYTDTPAANQSLVQVERRHHHNSESNQT